MNILQFTNIIESVTPAGWEFYATGQRTDYNRDRSVNDTMVLVLPNPYPTWYRQECSRRVEFSLMLFKVVPIKRTTTGTQQHNPNSPIELRDGIMAEVRGVLRAINETAYMQVVQAPQATFYDAPEGQSVNSQVAMEVNITADIYKIALTMDATTITMDTTAITI